MRNDPDHLARILKVLAVQTRVRILQLLRGRVLCVKALTAQLGVTQGAVSQHLRCMREAGLVVDERRGFHVHYRLNESTLGVWREEVGLLLGPAPSLVANTKGRTSMCRRHAKDEVCEKGEGLNCRPNQCSPAQIRKCHGTSQEHSCAGQRVRQPAGKR
jgi:DNA-binding transcriptional ArsR family regulator